MPLNVCLNHKSKKKTWKVVSSNKKESYPKLYFPT